MFRFFADALDEIGKGGSSIGENSGLDSNLLDIIGSISNIIFWIIGVIAVIILVYAGVQYIISEGNASKIERAKSTIQWAIVGLIVAIAAWAIVRFVITNIGGGSGTSNSDGDTSDGTINIPTPQEN